MYKSFTIFKVARLFIIPPTTIPSLKDGPSNLRGKEYVQRDFSLGSLFIDKTMYLLYSTLLLRIDAVDNAICMKTECLHKFDSKHLLIKEKGDAIREHVKDFDRVDLRV